jgi:hypothetical protein
MQQAQMTNNHEITTPALLHGTRCTSTEPDQPNSQPRSTGLGVFILNFQEQPAQAIYIKARLHACSLVNMAEVASLALASAISHSLNLSGVNFLSDCEQLVHFLSKDDISNPLTGESSITPKPFPTIQEVGHPPSSKSIGASTPRPML